MKKEVVILNGERNVSLTVYLLDVGGEFRTITRRPLVLVLPGGGYQFCSEREADPVALSYLKAGYHAAVLRYSVSAHSQWPNPLQDYEQAMEFLKEKAREWNIYADRIAVIGFSAGGHLAAAAATMSKNRPAAAILGYAVAGADVKGCSPTAPDTVSAVDRRTPPCFLFHTRNDNVVPVMNSIKFMEALTEHDITFESHIYSYGPHGFSTCDTSVQGQSTRRSRRVPNWVPDSVGWLREVFGDFDDQAEGLLEPEVKAHLSSDDEEFLSVDCTMGHVMGNPRGAELMEAALAWIRERTTASKSPLLQGEEMPPEMKKMVDRMLVRDALGFVQAGEDMLQSLDAQLRQIPSTRAER
ncbi:MAG: alpha/beta hydrolase [Lachnospiraceae bacterium]|nr:alpha/beta hydrolase [Lachnospiraceae bacterium]